MENSIQEFYINKIKKNIVVYLEINKEERIFNTKFLMTSNSVFVLNKPFEEDAAKRLDAFLIDLNYKNISLVKDLKFELSWIKKDKKLNSIFYEKMLKKEEYEILEEFKKIN
jgi:hypothetical protein